MYMRPYRPGLISAINRFWPKIVTYGSLAARWRSNHMRSLRAILRYLTCGTLAPEKMKRVSCTFKNMNNWAKKFCVYMRYDIIASFLQKKFLAKIFTYGSLASRWRSEQTRQRTVTITASSVEYRRSSGDQTSWSPLTPTVAIWVRL